jgi:hypothetical protein
MASRALVTERGVHSRLQTGRVACLFVITLTPEQIEPVRQAFNKVCQALDLNWLPDDPATDLIAERIMSIAATGELDPEIIYAQVLEQLKGPTGSPFPA